MRLVIYTAIFGKYDILLRPKIVNENIKYVCFTDKKIKCDPWEIRIFKREFKDPTRDSRKYKILSHKYFKNYQYSIYIDGNYEILADMDQHVEELLGNNDIAVLEHPYRNCIYEEAYSCIKKKKDDVEIIRKQIERYKQEGYPKNNGLTTNSFIIRRHNERIEKLNEMWWDELKNNSKRDQLSFKYVSYKLGINYSLMQHPLTKSSKYIKFGYHKKRSHFISLYFLIDLIKSDINSNLLLMKVFLKLLTDIMRVPLIKNLLSNNLYHRIKVPLILHNIFNLINSLK